MLETTLAGSLPKPAWLAEPERLWAPWAQESPERRLEAMRDATRLAIADQERSGLDIVSDGEQSRQHFVHGFLEGIEGIDFTNKRRIGIRDDRYEADCPVIVGALSRPKPVHADQVAFARQQTGRTLKFTLPGPMTIVDTLADDHYGDRESMAMAFADILNAEARDLVAAGADVIQFDEPAFNAYTHLVPGWGVAALNRAVAGVGAKKTAVHICYGYGIQQNNDWKKTLGKVWAQYREILPALVGSDIDQISLEFAGSRVPVDVLELVGDRKDVLVGAIDVASDTVETPDQVAAVIRDAMRHMPAANIYPCTNCGMAPMNRDLAYAKLTALAQGARQVRESL
ncbi:methionine synthase [Marivibrio halodurans]|uniref:Methionine synthase n=1 Tax=Marivibrio halodurans TaxID=2039722 RepID=A0A8J7SNW0_9PROT|nr:methionine synthase [Marivibrio halodurans]MBP5857931.1 methionine synthase [Marivibrio halodurans]